MQTFPARQSHFGGSVADSFVKKLPVRRRYKRNLLAGVFVVAATLLAIAGVSGQQFTFIPNGTFFPNSSGASETYSTSEGGIDLTGPFFQSLGSNGRACVTCHQPSDGMSVAAANLQQRFNVTQGLDPIFRTNDGSNCNHNIDVSSLAGRSAAYSLLRTRGLIRVAINVPANADYQVVSVSNPYGCNESDVISQYRRPLPATNLRFLSTVMFDGRESSPDTGTTKLLYDANDPLGALVGDLTHQAMDASNGHAQASPPLTLSDPRLSQIVNFEMALSSAQIIDNNAGRLDARGATGGPVALTTQPFFISINSSVNPLAPSMEQPGGVTPGDGQFSSAIFNPYDAWTSMPASSPRAAVARGQAIFDLKPINITEVAGINDPVAAGGLGVGDNPPLQGTCGTCHDTPNVGNHSFPTPLDIGTGDPDPSNPNVNKGGLDIRYLPSITVCKLNLTTDPPSPTSNCKTTTDLGQALIDGKFDHVGKIKGPVLRGLAARAPYFHNGSAQTLLDAVRFYETRFGLALTQQEESDLVAFLRTL
jgi:cytochrome c peroxidase